jgi:hypothetical protein
MATIVLVAMAATAGVTAAQTVTVNPNGQVSVVYDNAGNQWTFAQSTAGKCVYAQTNVAAPVWINVLGAIGSAPSAIRQPTVANLNTVTVFARGTDGNLYSATTLDITTATTAAQWSGGVATKLSGTVAANTGPVAVWNNINPAAPVTDVFFVDSTSHNLMMDGSSVAQVFPPNGGSVSLGGYVTATPGAVVTAVGGIDVFARGNPNGLYEIAYATGGWGGWGHFNNGALAAGTGPSAITNGGTVAVFVTGTNYRLYEALAGINGLTWLTVRQINVNFFGSNTGSKTLTGWLNLGGVISSSPSAVYNTANGNQVVLVRGADTNIWTNLNFLWTTGTTLAPEPIAAP